MNSPRKLSYSREELQVLSKLLELRLLLSKKRLAYEQGTVEQDELRQLFYQYRQWLITHPEIQNNEHSYYYLHALPDKDPFVDGDMLRVHVFQYFDGADLSNLDACYIREAQQAVEISGGEDRRFFDHYIAVPCDSIKLAKRCELRNTQQYLRSPDPHAYLQTTEYYSALIVNHQAELREALSDTVAQQERGVAESQKQLSQTLAMLNMSEASLGRSHLHSLSGAIDQFITQPTHKHYKKLMKVVVKLLSYHNKLQQTNPDIDLRKYRDHLVYTVSKNWKVLAGGLTLLALLARAIQHQDLIQETLKSGPKPTNIPHNNTSGRGVTYFTSDGTGSFEAQRDTAWRYQEPTILRQYELITGLAAPDIKAAIQGRQGHSPSSYHGLQMPYTPGSPEFIANWRQNTMDLRDAMTPTANGDSLVFVSPSGKSDTIAYNDFTGALDEIGRFPFSELDSIHTLLFDDLMINGLSPLQKHTTVVENVISYPLTGALGEHNVEGPGQVTLYLDYRLRGQELFDAMLHEILHSYVVHSRYVMIREGKTERLTRVYNRRVRGVDESPHHYRGLVFADIITEWLLKPYVQSHREQYADGLETETVVRDKVGRDIGWAILKGDDVTIDHQTQYWLKLLTDNPQHDISHPSLYFFISDSNKEQLRVYIKLYRDILARHGKNGSYIRRQFLTPSMVDELERIIEGDALVDKRGLEEAARLIQRYEQVKRNTIEWKSFVDRLVLDGKVFGDEIKIQTNTPLTSYVDRQSPYAIKKSEKKEWGLDMNIDIDRQREYTLYGLSGALLLSLLITAIRYEIGRRKYKHIQTDAAQEHKGSFNYMANIHTIMMLTTLALWLAVSYAIYNSRSQELQHHSGMIENADEKMEAIKHSTTSELELKPLQNQRNYHKREKERLEKERSNFQQTMGVLLALGAGLMVRGVQSGKKWRKKRPTLSAYKVMAPDESGEYFVQRQKDLLRTLMKSFQSKNPIRPLLPSKDPIKRRRAIEDEAYRNYTANMQTIMQTKAMPDWIPKNKVVHRRLPESDPYENTEAPREGAKMHDIDWKKTARLPSNRVALRHYRPLAEMHTREKKEPHFVFYINSDPYEYHARVKQETARVVVDHIVTGRLSGIYSLMQSAQREAKQGHASICIKFVRLDHVVYSIYRKQGQSMQSLKDLLEKVYDLYCRDYISTTNTPNIPMEELGKDEQHMAKGAKLYRLYVGFWRTEEERVRYLGQQQTYITNAHTRRCDRNSVYDAIQEIVRT